MVERFLKERERRRGRAQADQAVFDSIEREGKGGRSAVCTLCGGAPEVLMQPCNHLAACADCWRDASKKGAITCPACSELVVSIGTVKLCGVSRKDLA
jgi:hypothetical protein